MGRGRRDQRKREKARATSGSKYRLLGASGDVVSCFINADWREGGMAAIHMLKRVPGGGHASAAFLIDLLCCGLKDAWGRLDITYDEFMEGMVADLEKVYELQPVTIEQARRIVAGGVRFADQNGFRLPPRWERWAAMLGGVGDWRAADLTDFGDDGMLHYIGSITALRKRLVNGAAEEFLDREDVVYTLDDVLSPPDDDLEGVELAAAAMTDGFVEQTRKWCFANGHTPSPRLQTACEIMMESIMQSPGAEDSTDNDDDDADIVEGTATRPTGLRLVTAEGEVLESPAAAQTPEPSPETMNRVDQNLLAALAQEPDEAVQEIIAAMNQVREMMSSFSSPDDLFSVMRIEERAAAELPDESPQKRKSSRRRRRR